MPLVGVIDPAHRVSKSRTYGAPPPWITTEVALQRSLEDPKWAPWPWELLNALFSEFQERGDLISSSALVTACPRSEVIRRKADYVLDLRDIYIPFRGTMVHRTLEIYANDGAIAEHRFHTSLRGIPVSCAPDLLTRTRLTDYKVTEQPPYNYPWVEHKEQVQFNAFVCRNAELTPEDIGLPFDPTEFPVSEVALVYLGPKFPKVLRVESKGEPYIWDDGEIDKEFGPRLETFAQALESYPKWPSDAEKIWGGNPSWKCPGPPLCYFNCVAKRWPEGLVW